MGSAGSDKTVPFALDTGCRRRGLVPGHDDLNVIAGGSLRATALYAVPVVFAARHGIHLGFVFSAVGARSAWAGGSIPHPGLEEPLWIEGIWAFLKLSAVAVGTRIAMRQVRNRPST
jgi:hypothetical protein